MGKPKKPKKPRKLSAYNKFVKKHRLAGKSMKQIGRMWRGTGSNPKPKSRASPKKRSNPTGGTRKMPKNSFNMNKIYSLANKIAFAAPYVALAMGTASPEYKVQRGIAYISGYDMRTNTWSLEDLKKGWLPYVATKIMTSVVPRITSFFRGLF